MKKCEICKKSDKKIVGVIIGCHTANPKREVSYVHKKCLDNDLDMEISKLLT